MADLQKSLRLILRDGSLREPPQDEVYLIQPHSEARVSNHETAYRDLSNIFSLAHFCDRASCKRAKACRGDAERCLALYSDCVPMEAREFIVDLMTSREFGCSFEEALQRNREGASAFAGWASPFIALGNTDANHQ
ncbi:MAG: hypothetical protein AB7O79_09905 [Xanthobacteraceae bacterium]|jgi:hypothetical protein